MTCFKLLLLPSDNSLLPDDMVESPVMLGGGPSSDIEGCREDLVDVVRETEVVLGSREEIAAGIATRRGQRPFCHIEDAPTHIDRASSYASATLPLRRYFARETRPQARDRVPLRYASSCL